VISSKAPNSPEPLFQESSEIERAISFSSLLVSSFRLEQAIKLNEMTKICDSLETPVKFIRDPWANRMELCLNIQ
jgi:hypothetical protein